MYVEKCNYQKNQLKELKAEIPEEGERLGRRAGYYCFVLIILIKLSGSLNYVCV